MRIVVASSEAVPFAKTGGLADVASSLSRALAALGHEVWLMLPHYPQQIARPGGSAPEIRNTGHSVRILIGSRHVTGSLLQAELPGGVSVLLVDQPGYFDRPGLYTESGQDYKDNCERFVFFSRAVMETIATLDLRPDIIHANDWQTGLIPALLNIEYRQAAEFHNTASVFTIHNMAFHGSFWHWDMVLTGLDWRYFNWRQMEFFGNLNLLKTGIVFADMLSTVSPRYAREIQTPLFGCGLHGVLSSRRDDLVGILNGVDTDEWNPATDPRIPARYTPATIDEGKPACKEFLQRETGLPVRPETPVFGMISRLTAQKGCDLIVDAAELFCLLDLQLVVLGTGDPTYEEAFRALSVRFPEKVAVQIGFDENRAHQIEAGADAFLMPSRFEPCGLNQMYSLLYGTVPVVHAVGGLADSVVNTTPETLSGGSANGFSFDRYDARVLYRVVRRAAGLYQDRDTWRTLMRHGMTRDWSWTSSAAHYVELYRRALERLSYIGTAGTH